MHRNVSRCANMYRNSQSQMEHTHRNMYKCCMWQGRCTHKSEIIVQSCKVHILYWVHVTILKRYRLLQPFSWLRLGALLQKSLCNNDVSIYTISPSIATQRTLRESVLSYNALVQGDDILFGRLQTR